MTPPDHDGGPVLARLLALMGIGGGISTAADTVLHHILAGGIVASARATLDAGEDLGGVVAEVVAALESTGWRP